MLSADLGLELYPPSSVHPCDPCLALTVEAQLTLDEAPDDIGLCYWEAFTASLTARNRKELDMLLRDFVPRSDWSKEIYAKGLAEGEAKGEAKARAKDLLSLLEGRRFALDAKLRRRIASCTDLVKLESWFHKAITAESIEAIFVEPAPRHLGKAAVRRSRARARLLSSA